MKRLSVLGLLLAVSPTTLRGQQPVAIPLHPPVTVSSSMPVSATAGRPVAYAPIAMPQTYQMAEPMPVWPTVAPDGTCGGVCAKPAGLFRSLLNRLTSRADDCYPTSNFGIRTAPASCATGACPAPLGTRAAHTGASWSRFKAWLCWKPCGEILLHPFTPEPYRAPVSAYMLPCHEPTAGIPCAAGGHKKHGKKCPTGACETGAMPVGPVVAPRFPMVAGWLPNYGQPTLPAVDAAPMAPAKPPIVQSISRPFTSP